jgi:RHS repeat-associated protein
MTLDEIGLKFGTDKSSIYHNYLPFYERYRNEPMKLLEIGVAGGASLAMWTEYFPNSAIVGADIDPEVSVTQSFDANGNLLVQQSGSAFTTYTWDGENRLLSIALSPGTTYPHGTIVTNLYDGNGLRQGYQDSTGRTTLTYDGQNVYRRDVQSIESVQRYTNEPGDYSPLISQADTRGGVTTHIYAVSDLSGNIRNWWSAGTRGNLDPYAYEAFGQEWIVPAPEPPLSYNVPFFYEGDSGYYQDPTTGLYYIKARWYDPATGRFISEDPIWPGGGVNAYEYVANNPVAWVDPTGTIGLWPIRGPRPQPKPVKGGCTSQGLTNLAQAISLACDKISSYVPPPGLGCGNGVGCPTTEEWNCLRSMCVGATPPIACGGAGCTKDASVITYGYTYLQSLFWGTPSQCSIVICADNADNSGGYYTDPPSTNPVSQMAITIVHEMLHCCGRTDFGGPSGTDPGQGVFKRKQSNPAKNGARCVMGSPGLGFGG